MSEVLAVAIVGAVAPTIAAITAALSARAAARNAQAAATQLKPSNGKRVAEMVEDLVQRQKWDHDHLNLMHEDLTAHREAFASHVKDEKVHWRETARTEHICPNCLSAS